MGDDDDDDARRLQGTWQAVRGEVGGQPIPPELIATLTYVFTGDQLEFFESAHPTGRGPVHRRPGRVAEDDQREPDHRPPRRPHCPRDLRVMADILCLPRRPPPHEVRQGGVASAVIAS
jgi:hypothetical protein